MVLMTAAPAAGQAWTDIGSYLAPWGGDGDVAGWIGMSTDGQTILFMEAIGNCNNSGLLQRLSVIRPDGTGHSVLVDWNTLIGLYPNGKTIIDRLVMSGDGSRAAFSWPGKWDWFNCIPAGVTEWYLVDMATGALTPFDFNGQPVGVISYSDDGSRMAFRGWDPVAADWAFYLADGDGSNAVQFLDTAPWCGGFGVLSGDGNKFLIDAVNDCFCPCNDDILLYDIASGTTVKLNPAPVDTLGLSLSYDGSRVVYDDGLGNILGVNGDGSGLHVVVAETFGHGTGSGSGGGNTTITRDGEYVFYATFTYTTPYTTGIDTFNRSRFDGTDPTPLPGYYPGGTFAPLPVNGDGSLYASYDKDSVPLDQDPLLVWFEHVPVLTTSGYGHPGTPLTWDVGGEPGDSFLLVGSLGLLSPPAPTKYGPLQLDPASLFVLASGSIAAPKNIGSVQLTIPAALDFPAPLAVHFQALVQPPTGRGALTNRTTVLLQDATSVADTAPPGGRGPAWTAASRPQALPANVGFLRLTPEQRLARLAALDPQVGQWYFAGR